MSLFDIDTMLRTKIKKVESAASDKQVISCVLIVPVSEKGTFLFPLAENIGNLQKVGANPHVQMSHPAPDEDITHTYQIEISGHSDNPSEQKEHDKKKPLVLEDATLGRYTAYPMSDYEGSIGVSMKITIPIRSESVAGKIDRMAGEMRRVRIIGPNQIELPVSN